VPAGNPVILSDSEGPGHRGGRFLSVSDRMLRPAQHDIARIALPLNPERKTALQMILKGRL